MSEQMPLPPDQIPLDPSIGWDAVGNQAPITAHGSPDGEMSLQDFGVTAFDGWERSHYSPSVGWIYERTDRPNTFMQEAGLLTSAREEIGRLPEYMRGQAMETFSSLIQASRDGGSGMTSSPFSSTPGQAAAAATAASGGSGGAGSGGGTGGSSGSNPFASNPNTVQNQTPTQDPAHPPAQQNNPPPTTGNQGSDTGMDVSTGAGSPPIDPNSPLGIDFSRGGPAGYQGGAGALDDRYGTPGSILSNLDQNSTLNDVMLNIVRRQEANRDQALGIFGGQYEQFENDPLRQGIAQNAQDLQANPFSLDDATIQKILGRQAEQIGGNAMQQSQLSADRAAAMGISRSGIQATDQDRIGINAMRDLGDAQRNLLVEQATRRPQELAQAMGAGSNVLQQQQSARERSNAGAAGVLQSTDYTPDALLAGTLSGGGPPPINIASGPNTGPVGSVYFAGDARYNPFGRR